MKNYIAFGVLAAMMLSTLTPALANEWRDARHNQRRAVHQEIRAQRDAAMGDVYGAQRHAREAAHDQFRAQRDRDRAYWHE